MSLPLSSFGSNSSNNNRYTRDKREEKISVTEKKKEKLILMKDTIFNWV